MVPPCPSPGHGVKAPFAREFKAELVRLHAPQKLGHLWLIIINTLALSLRGGH